MVHLRPYRFFFFFFKVLIDEVRRRREALLWNTHCRYRTRTAEMFPGTLRLIPELLSLIIQSIGWHGISMIISFTASVFLIDDEPFS
jgi:hypothetical protein